MGLFGKSKKELERDAIFAILVLAKQRVVNYKAVITILGGQIAEMSVDNPRRKERGKAEPVGARAHEEAIVSVL